MTAVFEHLGTPGLFSRFIGKVCGCDRSARGHSVAANIGINEPHGNILCQSIERTLRRSVCCPAKRTSTVDGRDVDDDAVVLGQKYLQRFADIAHRSAKIGIHDIHHPFVIRLVDEFLFSDARIVNKDIKIAEFTERFLKYVLRIFRGTDVCNNTDRLTALIDDTLYSLIELLFLTRREDD